VPDEVFLTGATGFIGSHVLAALLDSGFRVRALVRHGSKPLPDREGCRPVTGDVRRPGRLAQAMSGCRYLMHVAALYSFSPHRREELLHTNVFGCAGLLETARLAGVERAVVTSSSATVGPALAGRPATEADRAGNGDDAGYHRTNVLEERVALAAQLPVILLLPTAPVGPGDWKPKPTGAMVLDFLRGRIFASLGGGLNVVAVQDVARAHVAALTRGRAGERYLIGGENLSLAELWTRLAVICGRAAPTRQIPYSFALTLAYLDELRCRALDGAVPVVPLEGVHMARHLMFVDDSKARTELGHQPTPVTDALAHAVQWYRVNGYAR
jgi:dihydroflavonol-4-reductase